jgi:periplasmic protein TonB
MARFRLHGFTLSLGAHIVMLCIVAMMVRQAPTRPDSHSKPSEAVRLVWTGAGSGDPGGRSREQGAQELRRAQPFERKAVAVPAKALTIPKHIQPLEASQRLALAAPTVATGLTETICAVEARPVSLDDRGPGAGPGAEGGKGGIGNGSGSGVGDGDRPGAGEGDGLEPGNGVSWPKLVQQVKPNYTPDAMRAQVQGMVELEIVVLPDGSVGRVRVVRSLDSRFGLDQEAIDAVRRWRFEPARRLGKAVPARVAVELSFNLR